MSADDSVMRWLDLLKDGDAGAVRSLWERYVQLLMARARTALGTAPRRMADEEDVAISAFNSFCCGVKEGRFPQLDNRDDLRHLLLMLTVRKAAHQVRRELAAKRGRGKISEEAALVEVISSGPSPEVVAEVSEERRRLFAKLNDEELCRIAEWKEEGYTDAEVAEKLGRSVSTVARKLKVIRDCWREEGS